MSIRFQPLCTLSVSHPYYGTGRPDLDFVVTDATASTLSASRLLARVRNGQLHVLFEADDTGTPLTPVPGRTLRVGLQSLSAAFANVTALAFDPGVATPLYRNGASPNLLDPAVGVALTGETLTHRITDSPRPVTLELKDEHGQTLATEAVTAAPARSTAAFPIAGPPGRYQVQETYPGSVQKQREYFFEPELVSVGLLAVVEIVIDAAFYTAPPSFTVAFAARTQPLKYYVVARNHSPADVGLLAIADLGAALDGRPVIAFDKLLPAAFTADDVPAAVLSADAPVVLFKSQTAVARTERPRHKIQLSRNGSVLVEQLPQPGPDRPKADVIVHLSKP
jgi:hypothetical protein